MNIDWMKLAKAIGIVVLATVVILGMCALIYLVDIYLGVWMVLVVLFILSVFAMYKLL